MATDSERPADRAPDRSDAAKPDARSPEPQPLPDIDPFLRRGTYSGQGTDDGKPVGRD